MDGEARQGMGNVRHELAAAETALAAHGEGAGGALAALQEVPLQVEVRLGTARLSFGEVMRLRPGSVVTLEQAVGQLAEVLVGGKVVARGQVVLVGDELGIRLSELCGPGGGAA